jgi:hypothetical protein
VLSFVPAQHQNQFFDFLDSCVGKPYLSKG